MKILLNESQFSRLIEAMSLTDKSTEANYDALAKNRNQEIGGENELMEIYDDIIEMSTYLERKMHNLAVSPNAAYKIKYLYVDPKRKNKSDYTGAQYSDVETLCGLILSSPEAIDAFIYSPQNEEEIKVKTNIIAWFKYAKNADLLKYSPNLVKVLSLLKQYNLSKK